jgi:hypothetical protein
VVQTAHLPATMSSTASHYGGLGIASPSPPGGPRCCLAATTPGTSLTQAAQRYIRTGLVSSSTYQEFLDFVRKVRRPSSAPNSFRADVWGSARAWKLGAVHGAAPLTLVEGKAYGCSIHPPAPPDCTEVQNPVCFP